MNFRAPHSVLLSYWEASLPCLWLCCDVVQSAKSGRRVWRWQGLQVTQCCKWRLSEGAALSAPPQHPTPSSHESRFHILPILLVGTPLVEPFLPFKRTFWSLSAQLMNMHHIPPPAPAASHRPFLLQLQTAWTFLKFGINTASVLVFVFDWVCS